MRQEEASFLENYCFNDLYKDLDIPMPLITLWSACKPFSINNKWFDAEEDLMEYMDKAFEKRSLYLQKQTDNDYFDSFLPGATRYDYIGNFAGENNVYIKTLLSYTEEGLKTTYVSIETKANSGNYLKILKKISDHYFWQDYISLKFLNELYAEFESVGGVLNSFEEGKILSLRK